MISEAIVILYFLKLINQNKSSYKISEDNVSKYIQLYLI